MIFYAQRKSVKNGEPIAPNNRYGTQQEMEYQFHLFCASAVKTDVRDIDSIEWGTVEQGVIERKKYTRPVPEPEEVGEAEE